MSPQAITRRLRRVSELVRVCRALAGPRRRPRAPASPLAASSHPPRPSKS